MNLDSRSVSSLPFFLHPPTQETTALAAEECVTPDGDCPAIP